MDKTSQDSLVDADNSMVETATYAKDNKDKVRKELLFLDEGSSTEHRGQVPSTSAVLLERENPARRFSLDIFELHTTPESISDENSVDTFALRKDSQLLSRSPNNICDYFPSPDQLSYEQEFSQLLKSDSKKFVGTNTKYNNNPHNIKNPRTFTPLIQPPSRAEVLSKLKANGFPEIINQEPFYSNPLDAAKSCEVGSTTLRLKSKSVLHLEEYNGTFEGISKWKEKLEGLQDLNVLNYNHIPSKQHVSITPLKGPPSYLQAQQWLKTKLSTVNKKDVKSKTFTKLVLPSSPGEVRDEDDEKDDDSITVSQNTPLSGTTLEEMNVLQSSPEITKNSITIKSSPLMASTPLINKSSKLKKIFSKSLNAYRQSLPLIREEDSSIYNLPEKDPSPESKVNRILSNQGVNSVHTVYELPFGTVLINYQEKEYLVLKYSFKTKP